MFANIQPQINGSTQMTPLISRENDSRAKPLMQTINSKEFRLNTDYGNSVSSNNTGFKFKLSHRFNNKPVQTFVQGYQLDAVGGHLSSSALPSDEYFIKKTSTIH